MHSLAVHLAPLLAAEKSKVPFYIAGGLLVVWALVVSLGIGMRREDFPGNAAAERMVIAITAVLVLAAVSTAVLTSGGATKSASAAARTPARTTGNSEVPAPASTATRHVAVSANMRRCSARSARSPASGVRGADGSSGATVSAPLCIRSIAPWSVTLD